MTRTAEQKARHDERVDLYAAVRKVTPPAPIAKPRPARAAPNPAVAEKRQARRASSATLIPAEIQAPMRDRLRLAREFAGLPRGSIKTISPGSLNEIERYEISRMKLGDLYGLATEFGWTLPEMLTYLAGALDEAVPLLEGNRTMRRMSFYLRALPERLQEIACNLVMSLVEYNEAAAGGVSLRHLNAALAGLTKDVKRGEGKSR